VPIRKTAKRRRARTPEMDTAWLGGEAFLGSGVTGDSPDSPPVETPVGLPGWISIAMRWIKRQATP